MKFEPEDFEDYAWMAGGDPTHFELMAKIANTKFKAWLDEAPEVKGRIDEDYILMSACSQTCTIDTHKAKLVCIEPLGESRRVESLERSDNPSGRRTDEHD